MLPCNVNGLHSCCDEIHATFPTPRVGQNCIYTPYVAVFLVISLPKIPYTRRIYMVLANPTHTIVKKCYQLRGHYKKLIYCNAKKERKPMFIRSYHAANPAGYSNSDG